MTEDGREKEDEKEGADTRKRPEGGKREILEE
jgi:hypothetical protein